MWLLQENPDCSRFRLRDTPGKKKREWLVEQ